MRRLLDFDPISREAVWWEDKGDGIAELHHTQDVGYILEANKMMANEADYTKQGFKRDWWHYARIPNIIALKWLKEDGIDIWDKNHKKAVFKKLADPMFRYLKTTEKKHL